ncbi:hypothetical protein Sdia_40290 [Streptomyces diastaticus subsp. diastaticus]|uniref:ATP-binding protein n=1 Tax=Streptomyces diastaticus subsp. diastaticus TaxID=68040 RepID=A0ABQ1CSF2_STRDI|nr:hypothetical protein [Streptomyces diastaticus]GFH73261.1 hypothetical protein Sdia_40290 [Streptomyces diastaticus subsp. diastaticus]
MDRQIPPCHHTIRRQQNHSKTLEPPSYTSAREYAGRSLFELLQNGYDAHPRGRCDGQVHVLLDEEEGEWGTLYVANGGTPFAWRNVERVCELAQSSKAVGEGIGNKGVGFRSVLLISDAPEIFSADPDGPNGPELDGYCFRFAHRGDVEAFLGDEPNAHEVAAEFPPLQVPLPLDEVPAICRELAAKGHVTVVRLPLLNEAARAEVRLRLRELAEAKAPVMLFLDRLASLTLERRATTRRARRESSLPSPSRPWIWGSLERFSWPGAAWRRSV